MNHHPSRLLPFARLARRLALVVLSTTLGVVTSMAMQGCQSAQGYESAPLAVDSRSASALPMPQPMPKGPRAASAFELPPGWTSPPPPGPAGRSGEAPAGDDLLHRARTLRSEQMVREANEAAKNRQYNRAAKLYDQAAILDPGNAEAKQGGERVRAILGRDTGTNLVEDYAQVIELRAQQAKSRYKKAMDHARKAAKAGNYTEAQDAVSLAKAIIDTNRQYTTDAEHETMTRAVLDYQAEIQQHAERQRLKELATQERAVETEQRGRRMKAEAERTAKVQEMLKRAADLRRELKYEQALDVLDQVLFLDPHNVAAEAMKEMVEDAIIFRNTSTLNRKIDLMTARHSVQSLESSQPDSELIVYPPAWPMLDDDGDGVGDRPAPFGPDAVADMKARAARGQGELVVPDEFFKPSQAGVQYVKSAPPGSLPAEDEEVWVIVRHEPRDATERDTRVGGELLTTLGQTRVPLPLQHTDVRGDIAGYIATVDVTQRFHNPYSEKIEAVYVFPLPDDAAVNEFVMQIGERRIRGIIREREQAERIYAAAKSEGKVASLLTQERANVFTQKVANIEPGKRVDVHIRYFHTLAYVDGWYEWTFPMVVGPRFNPPGKSDPVKAAARGESGRPAAPGTAVEYLRPDERSGHDIALNVSIDAGVKIEEVRCDSHVVQTSTKGGRTAVALGAHDAVPNRDFVLRYRVAGEQIKPQLITHRDAQRGQGFFTLVLYPPRYLETLRRAPMEMIFVVDTSGSMRGEPLDQAKAALDRARRHLGPDDTFQIIRFSNDASTFGDAPVVATPKQIDRARNYVKGLRGDGGTMMIEGVRAALDFPHDPRRLRFVTFLTDGFIGNEAEILGAVHQRVGASRVFSFGVGSSPNRFLLNRMAKLGRGAVAYLPQGADGGQVMDDFFKRISHPAMADIEIDWGDMVVADVYPKRIPDLFVGRPVVITGMFVGDGMTDVVMHGRAGDRAVEVGMRVNLSAKGRDVTNPGIPAVWARRQIADLADRATWDSRVNLPARVRRIALDHSLMSGYTAFVAVDALSQTAGTRGTTVPVAVPVPQGVRYETTVPE